MKLITQRPILYGTAVLIAGTEFETDEQHGRQLLQRGYATAVEALNEAGAEPTELASTGIGADPAAGGEPAPARARKAKAGTE